jgi:hypothetical protein
VTSKGQVLLLQGPKTTGGIPADSRPFITSGTKHNLTPRKDDTTKPSQNFKIFNLSLLFAPFLSFLFICWRLITKGKHFFPSFNNTPPSPNKTRSKAFYPAFTFLSTFCLQHYHYL